MTAFFKDIFMRLPMMLICLFISILLCVFAIVLHKDIVIPLVNIWINDVTFNHCFFVIPISIWLFYRKFSFLCRTIVRFEFLLIPLIMIFGIFAQIFYHIGINLLSQIMLVALLQTIIITVIGLEASKKVIYPIAMLFFLVPFGTEFVVYFQNAISYLMDFMAPYVGINIIRNGIHLHTDRISFYVAEACAGLRFLIANIFVMSIYGHLSFRTMKMKSYFFLLSIIFPLVGNILRVLMVIMIGYYSSGKYAAGFDHIVYGWGFFTVIAFLNFLVGEKLMKHEQENTTEPAEEKQTLFETWTQLSSYNKKTIFNIGAFPLIMLSLILPILIAYRLFINIPADTKSSMETMPADMKSCFEKLEKDNQETNQDRFSFKKYDAHNEWILSKKTLAGYYHYKTQNAHKDVLDSTYRFYDEENWLWQNEQHIELLGQPWTLLTTGYGTDKRHILYHYYDFTGHYYNRKLLAKLGFLKQVLTTGTQGGGVIYFMHQGIYNKDKETDILKSLEHKIKSCSALEK